MSSDPLTRIFVGAGVLLALYLCVNLLKRAQTLMDQGTPEPKPGLSGTPNKVSEQALIVKILLWDTEFGEENERNKIQRLEDSLTTAIEKKPSTGEFDGDEFGGGVCTIYMYGPSAAQLFDITIPVLLGFKAPGGSFVIKRFGGPGAKEERIPLGQPPNLS